jgi:AP-3 complex subunit delta-1
MLTQTVSSRQYFDYQSNRGSTVKYVALLAFNRIVLSHPALVEMQQDVIMDCLDDADISIRLQALELVVQMVSSETLQLVVNRLVAQLRHSHVLNPNSATDPVSVEELKASADADADDPGEVLEPRARKIRHAPPLPNDYRAEIIHRVLDICSHDNYSDILDFEWYVNILVDLVKLLPPSKIGNPSDSHQHRSAQVARETDIASRIGAEIRNVAVRVKTVRSEATRAAESFLFGDDHGNPLFMVNSATLGILGPAAWVVGEYAGFLAFPQRTLQTLIAIGNISLPGRTLSLYLQAIPKVFSHLISGYDDWNAIRRGECSLLLAQVISFLEKLATHPDLDVQERTIEFLELLRLTKEAINPPSSEFGQLPFLLTSVIPGLFSGLELNPVAATAQRKVPLPDNLDLNSVMNHKPQAVLDASNNSWFELDDHRNCRDFYYVRDASMIFGSQRESSLRSEIHHARSYQDASGSPPQESGGITKRRIDQMDRNKDDPFYIGEGVESSGRSKTFHQVFTASNGEELDIDSIPIIDLTIDGEQKVASLVSENRRAGKEHYSRTEKVQITADETFGIDRSPSATPGGPDFDNISKPRQSLLQVDSSALGHLSLDAHDPPRSIAVQEAVREEEDAEMIRAMQEVERLRLKMQRASERINARGIPAEGTLVKKRGRKEKKRQSNKQSEGLEETLRDENNAAANGSFRSGENPNLISCPEKKKRKKKSTSKQMISGM